MKKFYPLLKSALPAVILLLGFLSGNAQSFTAGNVAVFVANSATGSNTTGNIVEFSTGGTGAVLHAIPHGASVAGGLRFSGSATSTAYLTNSNDGSLLAFNGANSSNTSANVNTLNPRGIGNFNAAGTYSLATTYTGTSGNQTRSATTIDNTTWYIGDQGGIYSNGTTAASPAGNIRAVKSFGGTVYVSSSSSTATVIQVSTLSAPVGGTITGLPGLTNNASLQDYYLISSGVNGTSFDVLYVLSATSNTAGSIAKYSLVSGTWTANGTYTTTFGGFGLAAKKSGSGAELFVSTGQGALAANNVLRVTDAAGYNSTISITTANNAVLYTAPAGNTVKGVAFAPVAAAATSPTVNLSVSANAGSEAGTTVITVTATASAAVTGAQTIDLTVSGTGVTAGDYSLSATTISIANGATTGTATFTVIDDAIIEGTETAVLTISNPSAGITLGATVAQNIVITDNDAAAPTVNLSVSNNSGSEQSMTSITVTATASSAVASNQTVTLNITGAGITADDYILSNATITIAAGQSTGSVTFTIRNDSETEGTETAVLTISSPSAGIILGTTLTQNISITDNGCQVLIRKSTATSANGAEISAFDPSTNRIFTVAGPAMEYYILSSTGTLSAPTDIPFGFTPPAGTNAVPNSVVVKNGIVAVGYAIVDAVSNAQQPGVVAFYQSATATYLNRVTVGYLPDMLIYSPSGNKILTANEGEPNSYGQGNSFDPEGSVSIIDISGGVGSATVVTAGFTTFNANIVALRAAGVRIFGPGATVAQDLEPEYIAFSADGSKAYVALQENNAVAVLDMATASFTQILPLGLKNHNLAGNGLDASDRDSTSALGKINIQNWPIFGMYQPDAMSSFTVGGTQYFITANEGDSRAYTGGTEEIRVGAAGYVLDPTVFPNAAVLKLNQNLGRMQLTNATGDTDGDGDFDQIHAFGARSFSIWTPSFSQVFDSGDQLEQITAAQNPGRFNADNTDNTTATFDTRSDNKGPEPEAVTTGTVNGILYAFVGSERSGDIFVYDISNPAAPVFRQYIDNPADFGVEGLVFIPANQSPTGKPLIMSSAEVSRTVSVYEFSLVSGSLPTANTTITGIQDSVSTYGDCSGIIAKLAQIAPTPVAGSVTAKVFIDPSVQSYNGFPFVQRHYEITPAANAAASSARVTLYFTQAEFDNFNNDPASTNNLPTGAADASGKANLRVTKYPGASSDGSGLPASYTGAASSIDPNDANIVYNAADARWEVTFNVTGFSGFFIQTNAVVVPVSLISFAGKAEGNNSLLVWNTNNEVSQATYEVQYSTDARNFAGAGAVNALNTAGTHTYSFTHRDAALIGTKLYYRLKIISTDGTVRYSDVVIVRFGAGEQLITDVYPNPTKGVVKIAAAGNTGKQVTLRLYDLKGRLLFSSIVAANTNNTIDLSKFPSGIYLLEASSAEGLKQQFKIIKE